MENNLARYSNISNIPTNWGLNTFIVHAKKNKDCILYNQIDILLMIQTFVNILTTNNM